MSAIAPVFTYPVASMAQAVLGVIVVKLEFDRLESDWNNAGRPTFVTDERNIVLITSLPSWRFMTISSIDQEQLPVYPR